MKSLHILGLLLLLNSLTATGQNSSDWDKWIKTNSCGLSLSDTNDYQDLSFLKDILKDKRIVFLGENSHGVSEFTTLKSRMIRFLHDSLGFYVLAFESNLGDAYYANAKITTTDNQTSIYNAFSSLWHVEEIVPLFNYIRHTHNTSNPLILSGVDFIASNGSYTFSRFLYNLIFPINSNYAKKVITTDSSLTHAAVRGWTMFSTLSNKEKMSGYKKKDEVLSFYSNLQSYLNQNESKFKEKQDLKLAKYCVQDRIDFIHWALRDSAYMANKFPCIGSMGNTTDLWDRYRDYKMSQHLIFLYSDLYAGKKIIVWAENGHIAKRECRLAFDTSYAKDVYSIALLSYSGKGCYVMTKKTLKSKPYRPIYKYVIPTDSLSVEKIMHNSGHNITFLDMLYQKKSAGNSWMFDKVKNADGLSDVENIRNKWDGFILINKISPPHYLKFDYEYLQKQ
jgi:erythromycin esterase